MKGYFKRVANTPFRARLDLSGPVITVNPDQIIYAEATTFKDVVGFEFVGWKLPNEQKIEQTSFQVNDFPYLTAMVGKAEPPHKKFLEEKKKEIDLIKEIKQEETPVNCVDEVIELEDKMVIEDKQVLKALTDKDEIVKKLMSYKKQNWFLMKKDEAKQFLLLLNIDISIVKDNRNELIATLKRYIDSHPPL